MRNEFQEAKGNRSLAWLVLDFSMKNKKEDFIEFKDDFDFYQFQIHMTKKMIKISELLFHHKELSALFNQSGEGQTTLKT